MKIPLLKNTLTNYALIAVKMLEGFLLVRWMIDRLGLDVYGLWGILWSLLMYSVIVDFGFGPTLRKYTAVGLWKYELGHYNRIASTLFAVSATMMLPLLAVTAVAVWKAAALFKIDPAATDMLTMARCGLVIFGAATAVNFPLTLFGNMIVGVQRQYVQNSIYAVLKVVEFVLVCVIFALHLPVATTFYSVLVTVMAMPIVGNALVGVAVFHFIPGLRIGGGFNSAAFWEVISFSGWIYAGAVARLAIATVSPVIVGAFCGLTVAGVFQAGRKFPQLIFQLTAPYQENTSPLSARLWGKGRPGALGRILMGFMRWNALISTAMSLLVFALAPELIRFFFTVDNAEATLICRLFSIQIWLSLVANTVPEAAFLMVERHRFQILVSIGAALLTVVLNVAALLVWPGSAVAVTVAALVVVALTAMGANYPMLSHVTGIPIVRFVARTLGAALVTALPAAAAARLAADAAPENDFIRLAVGSVAGMVLFLPMGGLLLSTPIERHRLVRRLSMRVGSLTSALRHPRDH